MKGLRMRAWILIGFGLSGLLVVEHVKAEEKDLSEADGDFSLAQMFGELNSGSSDFQLPHVAGIGGFGGIGGKLSCNGCGSVCKLKCGTRRFRYCCFHYVRKRKETTANKLPPMTSNLFSYGDAESENQNQFQNQNQIANLNLNENDSSERIKYTARALRSEYFP